MPLAAIHPRQGITTIANVYLALLILPNDLHGGVDNIRVVFNEHTEKFFIKIKELIKQKPSFISGMYENNKWDFILDNIPSKHLHDKRMDGIFSLQRKKSLLSYTQYTL